MGKTRKRNSPPRSTWTYRSWSAAGRRMSASRAAPAVWGRCRTSSPGAGNRLRRRIESRDIFENSFDGHKETVTVQASVRCWANLNGETCCRSSHARRFSSLSSPPFSTSSDDSKVRGAPTAPSGRNSNGSPNASSLRRRTTGLTHPGTVRPAPRPTGPAARSLPAIHWNSTAQTGQTVTTASRSTLHRPTPTAPRCSPN